MNSGNFSSIPDDNNAALTQPGVSLSLSKLFNAENSSTRPEESEVVLETEEEEGVSFVAGDGKT